MYQDTLIPTEYVRSPYYSTLTIRFGEDAPPCSGPRRDDAAIRGANQWLPPADLQLCKSASTLILHGFMRQRLRIPGLRVSSSHNQVSEVASLFSPHRISWASGNLEVFRNRKSIKKTSRAVEGRQLIAIDCQPRRPFKRPRLLLFIPSSRPTNNDPARLADRGFATLINGLLRR